MILPADSYVVINKSIITDYDKQVLIDLYQPIIGNKAISLYFNFLNDLNKNSFLSNEITHHHLISIMQMSSDDIILSREKLEAVGLIKTYMKKDNINKFVYILYAPLCPSEFFNHPILNVVLYNNLGKKEYTDLINSYKIPRISLKDFDDISKKFDQVFVSVPGSGFIQNEDIVIKNKCDITFNDTIDFSLLISGLNIDEKAFTKEIKSLIINLCQLYNIDIITMQNIINTSLSEKGLIDKTILRNSCYNYYKFEHKGNLPTLITSKQPDHLKSPAGDGSKIAQMIYTFENTSCYDFLKSKYKGGKIVDKDLKLIESLLIDLKLPAGVVNVLVDYVLKVNNNKLTKNYVEAIASQWKISGIETVEEAMNACKKEYRKNNKNKSFTKESKNTEIIPEWYDKSIDKKVINKNDEDELNSLLSKYK